VVEAEAAAVVAAVAAAEEGVVELDDYEFQNHFFSNEN
jgi:hypothetical protein